MRVVVECMCQISKVLYGNLMEEIISVKLGVTLRAVVFGKISATL